MRIRLAASAAGRPGWGGTPECVTRWVTSGGGRLLLLCCGGRAGLFDGGGGGADDGADLFFTLFNSGFFVSIKSLINARVSSFSKSFWLTPACSKSILKSGSRFSIVMPCSVLYPTC